MSNLLKKILKKSAISQNNPAAYNLSDYYQEIFDFLTKTLKKDIQRD